MDPPIPRVSPQHFVSNCSSNSAAESSLTSSSWFSKSSSRSFCSNLSVETTKRDKPDWMAALEAEGWQFGETIHRGRVTTVKKAFLGALSCAVRFAHEAVDSQPLKKQYAMLCKLENKHIVRVEDLYDGESSSCCALLMEFVPGLKLSHILSWEGPMSLDARWSIFEQVLDALAYLHERRIAYQKLHPKKILAQCSRSAASLKLIDFGLATCCGDATGIPVRMSSASIESKILPPGVLRAGQYPNMLNDIFAAGLLAAGLVAGRSLLTKHVYPGSSLELPQPPSSAQLTESASSYLSRFLSLDAWERPTAANASRNLLQSDMWLEPRRRGVSITVSL
eukprot:TRINITY_DN104840_c0_g1_i1.p1 TRINITY_DN104840_c0_g1~~TRINITY_DN104840_c0_g1_i1.p1  ORF type:complete len:352 (-),score=47.51 TRINITY_DN104840_c0_g1_i1:24-1034(-)